MGTLSRLYSRRAEVPILRVTTLSDVGSSAFFLPNEVLAWFPPQRPWPHSRRKLRSRMGDIVRHCVGKSCPALSSKLGLILLTAQVVRSSDGLGFVILLVHPQVVTRVWEV